MSNYSRITFGSSNASLRGAEFPSFPSEKPSSPLVLEITRSWLVAGVSFRSKCIAKCTPAKLECNLLKCTRNGGARCYMLPPSMASLFPRGRHPSFLEERGHSWFFSPSSEGLRVRLDKDKGIQTKNSTPCTREPFALADQSWSRSRFRASFRVKAISFFNLFRIIIARMAVGFRNESLCSLYYYNLRILK